MTFSILSLYGQLTFRWSFSYFLMLVLVSFAKLFYSLVNKTENGPKKVFHTNTLEFLTMLRHTLVYFKQNCFKISWIFKHLNGFSRILKYTSILTISKNSCQCQRTCKKTLSKINYRFYVLIIKTTRTKSI